MRGGLDNKKQEPVDNKYTNYDNIELLSYSYSKVLFGQSGHSVDIMAKPREKPKKDRFYLKFIYGQTQPFR